MKTPPYSICLTISICLALIFLRFVGLPFMGYLIGKEYDQHSSNGLPNYGVLQDVHYRIPNKELHLMVDGKQYWCVLSQSSIEFDEAIKSKMYIFGVGFQPVHVQITKSGSRPGYRKQIIRLSLAKDS